MAEKTSSEIAIMLNGEPHKLEGEISVKQLVESLKIKLSRVAVELNREVVPKAHHADTIIRAGDVVEVINFVGGG
jgi:sulfur carrier protein